MSKTFKLTLEYDGTKYSGWQEQKNARTIMGVLRRALEDYFDAEIHLQGSGRTDAGVHAFAQVVHVRVPDHAARRNAQPATMIRELNDNLPADVSILSLAATNGRFHARHDALSRSYIYQISTRKSAFNKKYVWWVKDKLDVPLMQQAAQLLAGRHDFICFRALDPSKPGESTIVVVDSAAVETDNELVLFRIEASHFLWRMVRRIVGVLVKLGKHEITMEDFQQLLEGRCEPRLDVAAWTAPASGLFLEQVRYR